MKLIIEYSKTKRVIDGTFGICGSRADIESLAKQLNEALKDSGWSYGWSTIYSDVLSVRPNTQPIDWD